MSYEVSPTTGKLIKVGSKEFTNLLENPNTRKYFNYPDSTMPEGKVKHVSNVATLPLLPSRLPSMNTLPAIPSSPRSNMIGLTMSALPPIPTSPRSVNSRSNTVTTLPSSPRLSSLPPLPELPTTKQHNIKQRYPSEKVHLPSASVPTYKVWPQMKPDEHLEAILALPVYDIPSLEEVLSKTTQPHLRARLQTMIDNQSKTASPTRGWAARAPQKGSERHQLMHECGSACFLNPSNEGFPICPKCFSGKCSCSLDSGAIQSAFNRARQYGYDEVASKAKYLLNNSSNK